MPHASIPPPRQVWTVDHLKSDYIHDVISLDVFEHAVAFALRGAGYFEALGKANVLCDAWSDPATLYEMKIRGIA